MGKVRILHLMTTTSLQEAPSTPLVMMKTEISFKKQNFPQEKSQTTHGMLKIDLFK